MVGTRRSKGGQQNCLVIGGAGFLGRHLVTQLLDSGAWNVTVFDLRDASIPGVTTLTGDLRKLDDVMAACKGAPPSANLQNAHCCAWVKTGSEIYG